MAASPPAWFPGVSLGAYVLVAPLASGGMGQVWLARETHGGRLVVVKRMAPELESDAEHLRAFLAEAELAAGLEHPHVVKLHALGEHDGARFIVMEFLDGEPLSAVFRQMQEVEQPLSGPLVAQLVAWAAEGLQYVHTRTGPGGEALGLVHRDVTPHNLVVGYDGSLKLVDFGIALLTQRPGAAGEGKPQGKLAYVSPEQGRGEALDARSDVYSLGVVLFELVTRTRLYPDLSDAEVLQRVVANTTPPRAQERRHDVPDALDRIIAKATAPQRDGRFRSAGELQVALGDFLERTGRSTTPADVAQAMAGLFAGRLGERRELLQRLLGPGQTASSAPRSRATPLPEAPRPTPLAVPRAAAPAPAPPRWPRSAWVVSGTLAVTALGLACWRWAAAEPARHLVGSLEVLSHPSGAAVALDGHPQGHTPLMVEPLTAGAHRVELELEGHAPESRRVQVRDGQEVSLVVDLPPLGGSADAGLHLGVLQVETTPAATVELQGKGLGRTPLRLVIPAGTYSLRLTSVDRRLSRTIEVQVQENETVARRYSLK